MGAEDFALLLQSYLLPLDRQFGIRSKHTLGGASRYHESVYVNFVNLPKGSGHGGGGAEAENNRMSFWVHGFHGADPHAPPPRGVVKVEMSNSALPRAYKLRAKTGSPAVVAKYLATFLNKVVQEVEPKFTHSHRETVTADDILRGAGVKR
jgi:hypothetical protein